MLLMKQVEIAQRVEEEQARLRRISSRIDQIAREGKMTEQDVILKQVNSVHVLSIREVVLTAEDVGALLGQSAEALIGRGVQPIAPPFAIFHDPAFSDTDLDVEIVFPVAAGAPTEIPMGDGRALTLRELPGIDEVAAIIHMGSYDTLEGTYLSLGRWIEENAYQLSGPARELYLRPHMGGEVGITEIQFPVRKASR
jgi:effector-binding domain-containing protein